MLMFQISFGTYFYLLNPRSLTHRLNACAIFLSAILIFSEYYIYTCDSPDQFFYHNHNHTFLIGFVALIECLCTWYFAKPFKNNSNRKLITISFWTIMLVSYVTVFSLAIFTDQVVVVLQEKVDGKWGYLLRTETWAGWLFIGWYFFLIIIMDSLFYLAYQKAKDPRERSWKFWLFIGFTIIPFVMFLLFIIVPSSGGPARYEISIFYCIAVIILSWIFTNFKLFDITPKDAVENIIESVPNLIILTDAKFDLKYNNSFSNSALQLNTSIDSELNFIHHLNKLGLIQQDEILPKINLLNAGEKFEFSFTKKDNQEDKHYFFVVTKLIKNKDFHSGYTFIGVDISSLIQKENELKEYTVQLENTNNELERFAYIASHDLKTPLRNITSFLSLLKRKLKDNPDQNVHDYIDIVQTNSKNMYNLIEEILEYSKLKSQDIEVNSTDMNIVIELVEKNLLFYKETKDAVIVYENLPVILANTNQMTQLFQNIIENGLKYNSSAIPTVKISHEIKDESVLFIIKDNGIGISSDYHKTIFEIFKRLHNQSQFQGSGVGLAICKKIVDNHFGEIWVESEEGRGSTFYIELNTQVLEANTLSVSQLN